MSIYLSGKKTDPIIWAGGDIDAVYIGDTQVWPDISSMAGGIELEGLPKYGDEYWAAWWHTLRFQEMVGNAESFFFEVDGVEYHINDTYSKDVERVKLVGNIIELTSEQKKALQDKVGDTLTIRIPTPYNTFGYVRSNEDKVKAMPYLDGAGLSGDFELTQATDGSFEVEVSGVPSGTLHWKCTVPVTSADAVGQRISWRLKKSAIMKAGVEVGQAEAYSADEVLGDYGTRVKVTVSQPDIAVRALFTSGFEMHYTAVPFKIKRFF